MENNLEMIPLKIKNIVVNFISENKEDLKPLVIESDKVLKSVMEILKEYYRDGE